MATGGTAFGVDVARFDRVDDGAVGCVDGCDIVCPRLTCAAVTAEIEGIVLVNEGLILKRWIDNEWTVSDVDVFISVGSHVRLTIASIVTSRDGKQTHSSAYP